MKVFNVKGCLLSVYKLLGGSILGNDLPEFVFSFF